MASSSSSEKKIVLISSDEQSFEVPESAALLSVTIKNILEDAEDGESIPLNNVDSKTLVNVIEFCKRHASGVTNADETLKQFEKKFVEPFQREDLFDLVLAANYLDIKELLDVATKTIADRIQNLSAEDCRKYFNIVNDLTEEEEKKVREDNAWAFELDPIKK